MATITQRVCIIVGVRLAQESESPATPAGREKVRPEDVSVFILAVAPGSEAGTEAGSDSAPASELCRSYKDLQRVSRRAGPQGGEFPGGRLRGLLQRAPWRAEGAGWHPELKKSLGVANAWLAALLALQGDVLQELCDEDVYEANRAKREERMLSEKHARKMQQYFMCQANIDFIVQQAVRDSSEHTVYVEPSCGDGRLVLALAEQSCARLIVGCDLDSIVTEIAAAACRRSPHSHKCHIYTGDFLATTPAGLSRSIHVDIEGRGDLVLFGGPPYTLGGGDGSLVQEGAADADTGRDLPLQFISHAARALRPRRMVLLLPPRCAEPGFVERTKRSIYGGESETGVAAAAAAGPAEDSSPNFEWNVVTLAAPSNEFDFCGRLIKQPSVIQVWEFAPSTSDTNSVTTPNNVGKKRKLVDPS
jgi:hypothetical protein